jgi:LysB family phage lysis regulatory protein
MSTLRQVLYGFALLGALGVLLWTQHLRSQAEDSRAELASERQSQADQLIEHQVQTVTTLNTTLQGERAAQAALRGTLNKVRQGMAQREQQIVELKRENSDLRQWAALPLPDAASRLRKRPALTGADAYRNWLSSGSAVHPASSEPEK